MRQMKTSYDKFPAIKVPTDGDCRAVTGWEAIGAELRERVDRPSRCVVCVDLYHGVWEDEVLVALKAALRPDTVIETCEANKTRDEVRAMLDMGDDRVFAVMSHKKVEDYFDAAKVESVKAKIASAQGVVLVYGVAAAVCCPESDIYVYADMARWEIQMRFRSGRLSNWLDDNAGEDALRLYKRGFFADWRALDRACRVASVPRDALFRPWRVGRAVDEGEVRP